MLALVGLARKAWRPVWLDWREGRAVSQLERRLEAALAENTALKKAIAPLKTRSGADAAARPLGFVRQHEIPISIEERKAPKSSK